MVVIVIASGKNKRYVLRQLSFLFQWTIQIRMPFVLHVDVLNGIAEVHKNVGLAGGRHDLFDRRPKHRRTTLYVPHNRHACVKAFLVFVFLLGVLGNPILAWNCTFAQTI